MSQSVDYRDTLVTWLKSESPHHAAKNLGITYQTLYGRIKVLRKAGVNVPTHTRRGNTLTSLDVAQLNALINKHKKETA